MLWAGKELKVSVDAGLKQLEVISRGKDGDWEWVLVSGGHRDKRAGERARPIFIQFDSEGGENRVFWVKSALGRIIDFSSTEQTPW